MSATKKEMFQIAAVILLLPGGLILAAILAAIVLVEMAVFLLCVGIYLASVWIAGTAKRIGKFLAQGAGKRQGRGKGAAVVSGTPLENGFSKFCCCGAGIASTEMLCPACLAKLNGEWNYESRWMQ